MPVSLLHSHTPFHASAQTLMVGGIERLLQADGDQALPPSLCDDRLSLAIEGHARQRAVVVMGKRDQPLLWDRLLIKPFALLDAAEWVEIIAHHPRRIEVVRRG